MSTNTKPAASTTNTKPSTTTTTTTTTPLIPPPLSTDNTLMRLFAKKNWPKVFKLLPKATTQQLTYRVRNEKLNLIHALCENNGPVEILQEIIRRNVLDVNEQDRLGCTPLYMAILVNAEVDLVKELLINGANANIVNIENDTPLQIGLEKNVKPELIRLLLTYGGDPNKIGKLGWSPLHFGASCNASYELAEILLEHNANPNLTSEAGFTPLQLAVHWGNSVDFARVLLEYGAIPQNHPKLVNTLSELAQDRGHVHLIPILTHPPKPYKSKNQIKLLEGNYNCCSCCGNSQQPLLKCKGCGKVYYCNKICATGHWKIHKGDCLVGGNRNSSSNTNSSAGNDNDNNNSNAVVMQNGIAV
jgi:ankyrin repeat protein